MTSKISFRSIATASAFAIVGAFAIAAQTGSASAAKNVLSCDGTSRQSVIECCETLVRQNGLPTWLKRDGRSCRTASIQCTTKTYGTAAVATKKVCKIVYSPFEGGDKGRSGRNPGGRGQGNGQTSSSTSPK